jgi:hypothetical protein
MNWSFIFYPLKWAINGIVRETEIQQSTHTPGSFFLFGICMSVISCYVLTFWIIMAITKKEISGEVSL